MLDGAVIDVVLGFNNAAVDDDDDDDEAEAEAEAEGGDETAFCESGGEVRIDRCGVTMTLLALPFLVSCRVGLAL